MLSSAGTAITDWGIALGRGPGLTSKVELLPQSLLEPRSAIGCPEVLPVPASVMPQYLEVPFYSSSGAVPPMDCFTPNMAVVRASSAGAPHHKQFFALKVISDRNLK